MVLAVNDTRAQVFAVFFRNVLDLPTQNPRMTEDEVIRRKKEFLRVVGLAFDINTENDWELAEGRANDLLQKMLHYEI